MDPVKFVKGEKDIEFLKLLIRIFLKLDMDIFIRFVDPIKSVKRNKSILFNLT